MKFCNLHRTPEQAAAELANAIRSNDLKHIHSVLGPGSGKVIHSGDPVLDGACGQRRGGRGAGRETPTQGLLTQSQL
jgi:hypothetical protein